MTKNNNLNENVSDVEVKELFNLAMKKKKNMRFRTYESFINGDYKVRIGGIGNKSIKCEIYLDYERILDNKDTEGLEQMIYNKLLTIGEPK